MAEISFSLADLFEKAFGYKTKAFSPGFPPAQGIKTPFRSEQGSHGSPYYAKDALGAEYYMPVTLIYPDAAVSPSSSSTIQRSGESSSPLKKWSLPYPIISISSRKTIVETPLTERRGTVKELINIEDYEIVIKGFIVGNTNEFPESEVATLCAVYEQNVSLSIQCPLTDIFLLRPDRSGSDQVVIKSLTFPSVPGVKNVRPYELHLVSDEPFNLISITTNSK
jgi:hypothetical protein